MELLLISIALLSILFFLLRFLKPSTTYSHLPGPPPLPLIGNLHQMLRSAAAPNHFFKDLAAKYGPLTHLQLGENHFIIISSLDLAKQVMKTHDINFANRPPGLIQDAVGYNCTDVVFSPYGDYWRQLKKICTLELLSVRRVRSFRHIREEENLNMCKSIASCQGSPTNLSERLYMSSYDVITRAAVGEKTGQRAAVVAIIEEVLKISSGFMIADLYPSSKLLALITGASFKIRQMRRKMDEVFDGIIEQHIAKAAHDDGVDGANAFEDLVDVLLKIQKDGTELPLTTENIKAVMVVEKSRNRVYIKIIRIVKLSNFGYIHDMFVAGTDTSATTVEWAISEMFKNPNILKKAQEEVRRVFDDKGYVDEDKFDELKYLKLIIKETLRFHAPSPLLVPRLNTTICDINGYKIPANTRVIVNAWALGRDPRYWNDPESFLPERFEEESKNVDFKGNNLQFIPFGAGRRMCPGMAFAVANVEFPLAVLLYHFDWEMPKGMKNQDLDMTAAFGATVGRKHHLHMVPILKRPLRTPPASLP